MNIKESIVLNGTEVNRIELYNFHRQIYKKKKIGYTLQFSFFGDFKVVPRSESEGDWCVSQDGLETCP